MAKPRGESEGNDLVKAAEELRIRNETERKAAERFSRRCDSTAMTVARELVEASFGKRKHRRGNAF
jgi:hypothetical protein